MQQRNGYKQGENDLLVKAPVTCAEKSKSEVRKNPLATSNNTSSNPRCVEPSGSRIRSKYLHRIGLTNARPRSTASRERKISPIIVIEPLKRDYGEVDEGVKSLLVNKKSSSDTLTTSSSSHDSSLSSMSSADSSESSISSSVSIPVDASRSATKHSKKGVSFDAVVAVKPIPMRSEYSDRIKRQLWPSPHEMHLNASRNAVEFAAENYDWRLATEDSDFYVDVRTGERVHPVHYVRYVQQRATRQFEAGHRHSQKDSFLDISRRAARQWAHI